MNRSPLKFFLLVFALATPLWVIGFFVLSLDLGLEPIRIYQTVSERLYEKPSTADQPPQHEADHGSIYERFAACT